MKLHHFIASMPPAMGKALAEFEREFTYPLGTSERFRISHGHDYLTFFRAIGEANLTVVEEAGAVQGVLARVRRTLTLRGASDRSAHYLCDLKVRAAARGSTVLPRLIRETKQKIEASDSVACYCVVMEGTGKSPADYTGRLGVPRFEQVGEIVILRLEAGESPVEESGSDVIGQAGFAAMRKRIFPAGYMAMGAGRSLRSQMAPLHLANADGSACGILEDTRRGKRLFREVGGEIISGHISGFSYANAAAGGRLLREALRRAVGIGIPAVFVAVPASEKAAILAELEGLRVAVAHAGVFGHGLESGRDWWVDTAEI